MRIESYDLCKYCGGLGVDLNPSKRISFRVREDGRYKCLRCKGSGLSFTGDFYYDGFLFTRRDSIPGNHRQAYLEAIVKLPTTRKPGAADDY